nr:uncharacterized protein LOC124816209 [Hydra vulgaris]
MNQICQHCGAKIFLDETHFLCWHNGKVALPPLSPLTQALQDLFTRSYVNYNANVNFLKHIRSYNAYLSSASFTANVVQPINHGLTCFKICRQIFPRVGGNRRRYNLPLHDKVAVVFVGENGALPTSREVVIYPKVRLLKIVSSVSANLDPMIYPLFFPRGNTGWYNQLVHNPELATLVHLPENQIVYFREGEEQVALDRAAQRDTHHTAWFKLNSENKGAHRYSYVNILYHFVFDDKHSKWKVKGAKSWEDLHTVSGLVLETFRKACVLKGLLQDDSEWQRGFIHRQVPFILAEQTTLCQIEKNINQSGKTLSDYNLPVVDEFINFNLENLNDNVQQSIDEANRMRQLLNINQLIESNDVLAALNEQTSVENQHLRLFFMDGPAGSGKTFTNNYLIAQTSSRGVKSATAAWTGIAATLLTNGTTLHGL